MLPPKRITSADPEVIVELRMRLTETRIELRKAEASFVVAKAQEEQDVINRAGGEKALGSNSETRARLITLALADSETFFGAEGMVTRHRDEIDRLQAALDGMEDTRRAYEWSIRARLCDALENRGTDEFRDAADNELTRRVVTRANGVLAARASDVWEGADDGNDLPF